METEVKEIICISCPVGCRLTCTITKSGVTVTGNSCARGITYGKEEVTAPKRMVTTTVPVSGGPLRMLPVRTSAPVPKEKIWAVIAAADKITANAPVKTGEVLAENIAGTEANLIATADAEKSG